MAGQTLDSRQIGLLARYRDWLIAEALPAGGIGPAEATRIDDRHIADSLLFAIPMVPPDEIWDLGSGVGLPGIPLAIMFPDTAVTLIDRSGRGVELMRRAIRILDLDNVRVEQRGVDELSGLTTTIVSRACLPPERMRTVVERHLGPGGMAVVGGSWIKKPSAEGWEILEISPDILDQVVWLLIIRRQ